MDNQEKLDKAKQVGGNIIHDRIIPKIKNAMGTEAFTLGGLAAGTALGMKKGLAGKAYKDLSEIEKKQLLRHSITHQGLNGMAAGSASGNFVVPAARLTKLHREEFGTNPGLKDYAKVEATHGVPTALYWGAVLHNRKGLEKGLTHAAEGIESFKNSKKIKDLKPVLHAGAGAGGLAAADQATDLLEFFNTPEAIIKKKKEELAKKNGGENMPKSAYEIIDIAMEKQASIVSEYETNTALSIIDEAIEKSASIEEEMTKEASTFGEILRGDNVKKVDSMINGVGKAKQVSEVASRVPGFIERTTEPHLKDLHEMANRNQYLKHGENGTINVLDNKRTHYHKTDAELSQGIKDKSKEIRNKKQSIEDHVNQQGYFAPEEGKGSRWDDAINKKKYQRNAQDNAEKRAIIEKIKNGEDLSMEEKHRATKLDNKFGIDVRSGSLKNMHEDIKGSHADLKAHTDEQEVKQNLGKIHNYNKFKNVTNNISNAAGETGRVSGDFDKTFTVNGKVPSEGLSRLRNTEQAKTFAARGAVGGAALGAGMLANKAINGSNKPSQTQVNPYKNNYSGPRQNSYNNDAVGKIAEEIITSALEK